MREQVKFQFDNSFEDREAEQRDRPRPKFTEADLDAARNEGFAAGQAAGLKEASTKIEAVASNACAEIAKHLSQIGEKQTAALAQAARNSVQLAARVATKLAPAVLRRFGHAEVEALLFNCMNEMRDEPRIVLRASETIVEALRPRIGELSTRSGYPGLVVLLPDDSLGGSDCRIEWADGGMERDVDALIARIEIAINRFLESENDLLPAGAAPERSL